ncbi:MAG: GTP 3',8-cyclase MoaA [Candidatus Sumerlaeia bacterium]
MREESSDAAPMRVFDYLRVSVTDRCNFRCTYCMPEEGIDWVERRDILTFEEIARLVRVFAGLGVRHLRFTGGEPTVRHGLPDLVAMCSGVPGIAELSMTTNGLLLRPMLPALRAAGLQRLNISLDTLDRRKFFDICRRDHFDEVVASIREASGLFSTVKINVCVMRGVNDDEFPDFVEFARMTGCALRFIEYMKVSPMWRQNRFLPIEDVMRWFAGRFRMAPMGKTGPGPAKYWILDNGVNVGFIQTNLETCSTCSRLRLTSFGQMRNCLYEQGGLDLRTPLRAGADDDELTALISAKLRQKPFITHRTWEENKVYLTVTGG